MDTEIDKINVEELVSDYKIMDLGSLRHYLKEVYLVSIHYNFQGFKYEK